MSITPNDGSLGFPLIDDLQRESLQLQLTEETVRVTGMLAAFYDPDRPPTEIPLTPTQKRVIGHLAGVLYHLSEAERELDQEAAAGPEPVDATEVTFSDEDALPEAEVAALPETVASEAAAVPVSKIFEPKPMSEIDATDRKLIALLDRLRSKSTKVIHVVNLSRELLHTENLTQEEFEGMLAKLNELANKGHLVRDSKSSSYWARNVQIIMPETRPATDVASDVVSEAAPKNPEATPPSPALDLSEREKLMLQRIGPVAEAGEKFGVGNVDLTGLGFKSRSALSTAFSVLMRKLNEAGKIESGSGKRYRQYRLTGDISEYLDVDYEVAEERAPSPEVQPQTKSTAEAVAKSDKNFIRNVQRSVSTMFSQRDADSILMSEVVDNLAQAKGAGMLDAGSWVARLVKAGKYHYVAGKDGLFLVKGPDPDRAIQVNKH